MLRVPLAGLKAQSNTARCSGFKLRRAFDRPMLVDVADNRVGLLGRVAEFEQRLRNRVVDDLHHAAADQFLVFHQGHIGFHAGGIAIHHEADGAGRREHGDLGVAVAVLFACQSFVPNLPRGASNDAGTLALSMLATYARCMPITSMNGSLLRSTPGRLRRCAPPAPSSRSPRPASVTFRAMREDFT